MKKNDTFENQPSIESEDNFNLFMNIKDSSTSKHIEIQKIKKDLVYSCENFVIKYTLLILLGYFISLSICEQHGLGFFIISQIVAHQLEMLPGYLCPIICGSVFTGLPFLISFIFISRFQQRYLIFHLWWLWINIPIIATLLVVILKYFISQSQHMHLHDTINSSWDEMIIWAISGIITPYIMECIVLLMNKKIMTTRKFKETK